MAAWVQVSGMSSLSATFFGSLLVVALVSGCIGGGSDKKAPDGDVVNPTAGAGDDTCGIEGFIMDEEELPIVGAQVMILNRPDDVKTSSATGAYAFSFLPAPGPYKVTASRIGHNSRTTAAIDCPAGEVVNSDATILKLTTIADPKVAFKQDLGIQTGRVGCAVRVVTAGANPPACAETNNAKTIVYFAPDVGNVTGAIIEADWTPQTGLFGGQVLTLKLQPPESADVTYTYGEGSSRFGDPSVLWVTGPPPIRVLMEANDPINGLSYEISHNETYRAEMTTSSEDVAHCQASPGECSPADVVYDMQFDVAMKFFYYGYPVCKLDQAECQLLSAE